MSENHRGPEVPEEEVPVVERLDGLARITSEELVTTHFVNDGREHRDGCVKLSETIEWWMSLVFLTMNGL